MIHLFRHNIENLSDSAFIGEYKSAMSELYAEPLKLAKDSLHEDVKLSSYGETPIRRTWWEIDDHSWEEWSTDSSIVDYMMNDSGDIMNSEYYEFT